MLLELAFQSLYYRRELALPSFFDLLPKLLLDAAAFLQIALLILLAPFRFQIETRLPQRVVCFVLHAFPALRVTIAQEPLLFRWHLQPTFRV